MWDMAVKLHKFIINIVQLYRHTTSICEREGMVMRHCLKKLLVELEWKCPSATLAHALSDLDWDKLSLDLNDHIGDASFRVEELVEVHHSGPVTGSNKEDEDHPILNVKVQVSVVSCQCKGDRKRDISLSIICSPRLCHDVPILFFVRVNTNKN